MSVKIRVSDKMKKHPTREYTASVDPSLNNRYWYKDVIDQYAREVGHPKFNKVTMKAHQYYDRFWAEILREAAPVATVQTTVQQTTAPALPVPVTTAKGEARVFTVVRKGQAYSFTSVLSDAEAWTIANSIQGNDREFAQELCSKGMLRLSVKQWAWVHKLAYDELRRKEDPRALNNPNPPPPPPVAPSYPAGSYTPPPIKSRYKPNRRTNPNRESKFMFGSEKTPVAVQEPVNPNVESADVMEASTLGLKPGDWPTTIEFGGLTYTKFKVFPDPSQVGCELEYVLYSSDDVFFLKVLND